MSEFFSIVCFTCFLGACHKRECIGEYLIKFIAYLYIFQEDSSIEKKINNGTNETCILSIY